MDTEYWAKIVLFYAVTHTTTPPTTSKSASPSSRNYVAWWGSGGRDAPPHGPAHNTSKPASTLRLRRVTCEPLLLALRPETKTLPPSRRPGPMHPQRPPHQNLHPPTPLPHLQRTPPSNPAPSPPWMPATPLLLQLTRRAASLYGYTASLLKHLWAASNIPPAASQSAVDATWAQAVYCIQAYALTKKRESRHARRKRGTPDVLLDISQRRKAAKIKKLAAYDRAADAVNVLETQDLALTPEQVLLRLTELHSRESP
ncbi:hypothetical protein Pelo_9739 [Pelomyxa schiedti]|nr:hypothetical protein Pelo_9739 [Pelomyxa schiedti]